MNTDFQDTAKHIEVGLLLNFGSKLQTNRKVFDNYRK